jgi:hypothetical protein
VEKKKSRKREEKMVGEQMRVVKSGGEARKSRKREEEWVGEQKRGRHGEESRGEHKSSEEWGR